MVHLSVLYTQDIVHRHYTYAKKKKCSVMKKCRHTTRKGGISAEQSGL
ncbi:hypothetical protein HMPREF0663_10669 [Hoylesella oralis ATCC 33269]|uniref:Uncharacterized protein n=1 Tax=Hoylesella oralis ATCC 33269 TaxID=873533 RepID=E7RNG9_9BACT|nr:hypothetical protein HMPREF0663_10669 [Hoylesella oralis ATCC 33269]